CAATHPPTGTDETTRILRGLPFRNMELRAFDCFAFQVFRSNSRSSTSSRISAPQQDSVYISCVVGAASRYLQEDAPQPLTRRKREILKESAKKQPRAIKSAPRCASECKLVTSAFTAVANRIASIQLTALSRLVGNSRLRL